MKKISTTSGTLFVLKPNTVFNHVPAWDMDTFCYANVKKEEALFVIVLETNAITTAWDNYFKVYCNGKASCNGRILYFHKSTLETLYNVT